LRADRLLSALMLLQARGRLTGRELAERLEVSERTVHRDMEALISARVPLAAVRGAQGGWELERGWRTQVPGLDEAELQALMMAQPRVVGDTRLAAAAERALNKLMASLPGPLRAQATAMRERLHIDATGWWESGEDVSMLAAVQDAVSGDLKLAFLYTRADGQKGHRNVDPLGIVAKGAHWYLVARAPNGMRTYRVSRMEQVTALAGRFERPSQFDLAAYWKATTERLEEQRKSTEVVLLVLPESEQKLSSWAAAERLADEERLGRNEQTRSWVKLKVRFDDEMTARFVVLGLGAKVRVLGPDDFRRWILAEAHQVSTTM
jgi:predicted DNA-binding transcriptional regulator YafY